MADGVYLIVFMELICMVSYAKLSPTKSPAPVLQQAIIISRHGSRDFLTKHHKTFTEGADSPLTIRGMDQMFEAGQYVRQRYGPNNANLINAQYNSSETYVRSSDYRRTITSAQSFLLGLYPPMIQVQQTLYPSKTYYAPYNIQQIPVHTAKANNDQMLRGWLRCPVFQDRIAQFYNSDAYKKKEKDNADFLKTLEQITGIQNIELKDFYNVYDFIHLHLAYGHQYLNITHDQWQRVVQLAGWLEYNKYKKDVIQDVGAGILMNEITQHFTKTINNVREQKLFYYSAHYPTILSLFSILGVNVDNAALQTIPYYASLLFLELYKADKDYYVMVGFRNGLKNDSGKDPFEYYTIPGCQQRMCPLDRFTSLFKSLKVYDKQSWCSQCNNVEMSECRHGKTNSDKVSLTAVGGFFLGFFVSLVLCVFTASLWHFCFKKKCINKRPKFGLPDYEHPTL